MTKYRGAQVAVAVFGLLLATVVSVGVAQATVVTVNSEAEYRAALESMGDPAQVGPHKIVLGSDVSIGGPVPEYLGSAALTIDGGGFTVFGGPILSVPDGHSGDALVVIQDIKITGGSRQRLPASAVHVARGELTIENAVVVDGGGSLSRPALVVDTGTLTIVESTIADNFGGAAVADDVVVRRSTITGNTVTGSSVSEQIAGGVSGRQSVEITNSTLTRNQASASSYGAANIGSLGSLTLIHSTVTEPLGGGGASVKVEGSGSFQSFGSLVADSGIGQGCVIAETVTVISDYSFDGDGSCGFTSATDLSGFGPSGFQQLADNGGSTATQFPAPWAVDAIPRTDCRPDVLVDQRGVVRPQGIGCDIGAVEVFVANRAPLADPSGPYLVAVNSTVDLDATGSSDPDFDPLTYLWSVGAGTLSDDMAPSPTYMAPGSAGIYEIALTVDDGRGGTDTATTTVVVYDPDGGFVTGSGSFESPPGSMPSAPELTGQARFSFVAKYVRGSASPKGSTSFRFQAAGLEFWSKTHDWLVVTGSGLAKFKGNGSVNGVPGFSFQIWVRDDETDTFRIKIWQPTDNGDLVLYDSGVGQPISHGNIIVHEK